MQKKGEKKQETSLQNSSTKSQVVVSFAAVKGLSKTVLKQAR